MAFTHLKHSGLLFLLSFALLVPLAHAGTVTGTVDLSAAPKPQPASQRYAGQSGGEKTDPPPPAVAVVYLSSPDIPASAKTPPTAPVELVQKGLQFFPGVLPIIVGTKVSFPNQDAIYHNVFSYSKTKSFDLGRYAKGSEPKVETFDTPGAVKLFCEVHSHMRSTILVLETPYFTTTDATGKFRIENVPSGTYTLNAWVSEKKLFTRPITVTDAEIAVGEIKD